MADVGLHSQVKDWRGARRLGRCCQATARDRSRPCALAGRRGLGQVVRGTSRDSRKVLPDPDACFQHRPVQILLLPLVISLVTEVPRGKLFSQRRFGNIVCQRVDGIREVRTSLVSTIDAALSEVLDGL